MKKAEFWKQYNSRNFEKLQAEFERGLGFDFDVEAEAVQAHTREDYELLHFLWKVGAQGKGLELEDIFDCFADGDSYEEVAAIYSPTKEEVEPDVDLTNYGSVADIPIGDVLFFFDSEEEEFGLRVSVEPFSFQGRVYATEGVCFRPLELEGIANADTISGGKITFEPVEFDESICLFSVHNPVELRSLELRQVDSTTTLVRAEILFNFEFEKVGKSEMLTLERSFPTESILGAS